jgi:hypothetical protein
VKSSFTSSFEEIYGVKRLLAKIALLTCLVTATLLFPFYTTFPYKHSLSLVINKLALVKNSPSPKIIFVGGSGTYSGLDSRWICAEIKSPVVNMGIYAGIGVLPLLHLIEPYLKANDVVVIIPEYGLIHSDLLNTDKTRKWLLSASPLASLGRYYSLSSASLRNLLCDLAELSTSKLGALPQTLLSRSFEGYYKSEKVMDQFGDMTDQAQFDKLPSDKLLDRGIVYSRKPIDPEAIRALNTFAQSAGRSGCKVFFIFAAFPEEEYKLNRDYFDAIYRQIQLEVNIPILGAPHDFLYPYQYFQDSVNHLSAEGKTLRTRKVLELLNPKLPKGSSTNPALANWVRECGMDQSIF